MNKNVFKKVRELIVILVFVSAGISAQEINDAINAYNEGVAIMRTDPESAIAPFENCIKICESIGDSTSNEVKNNAVQVLTDLYFQKAYTLLTTDKKIEESIAASKVALSISDKYGSDKTRDKTEKLMIQAYSSMGSEYFSNNENEKAIKAFDSVLLINPDYHKAIYNKALTYKKMNSADKFGESIDLYLSKLNASEDDKDIQQGKKLALDFFRIAGSKSNKANKLGDALKLLNKSLTYGENDDVYYQLASVYNKKKNFTEAATNAQKGLDMSTGTPEQKAKYYYELAAATAGKGDTTKACELFKKSMYGPFVEASKAQRTNLKCQ